MNNRVWLFFALFALLLGCSPDAMQDEVITADDNAMILSPAQSHYAKSDAPPLNPHLQGKAVERPIQWRDVSGVIRFLPPPNDCDNNNLQVLIEGYGQGSHVGRFHVTNTYCLDSSGKPIMPITGIITAANGDQIFVVMTGSWEGDDGDTYWSYDILDGTGRFSGATGSFTNHGFADYVNLVWALEGEGVIVY